ncbi:hypothetical protein [Escherichia coli]|uniref:hypothetical protein n=1 Tax=Escherichia coli TaxID=562 RepID=UPI00174E0E55|nr:hypothetical protein [Escherichia coli]QOE52840.1 hypothetical protein IE857_04265 [Escherichia coli]
MTAYRTLPRYFIRTPYNGVLASQTRHDYCPQSSMIRGVMSPGLVGRWEPLIGVRSGTFAGTVCNVDAGTCSPWLSG